ncbi:MAG: hypothetical protein ACYC1Q_07065, partial [Bacteroidia bacterium]
GQFDSIEQIEQIVQGIDADTNLKVREFDASEVYNPGFDGGGIISVYFDSSGIKKFHQEIGVSFGRLTTIIYFDNSRAVKIVDCEENFKWRDDNTGWDYSEIKQVFQADIYIFDWAADQNKTIRLGERNLSEGTCSIFEYKNQVKLGPELLRK